MGCGIGNRRFLVLATSIALMIVLSACGGGNSNEASGNAVEASAGVATDSVVVEAPDGSARLEVPVDGLPEGFDASLLEIMPLGGLEVQPQGTAHAIGWRLLPDGLEFSESAVLTLTLTAGDLNSGVSVLLVDRDTIEMLEIRELPADPGRDPNQGVVEVLDRISGTADGPASSVEISVEVGHFSDVIAMNSAFYRAALVAPPVGSEFAVGDSFTVRASVQPTGVDSYVLASPDGDITVELLDSPSTTFHRLRASGGVATGDLVRMTPFRQETAGSAPAVSEIELTCERQGPALLVGRHGSVFEIGARRGIVTVDRFTSAASVTELEVQCVAPPPPTTSTSSPDHDERGARCDQDGIAVDGSAEGLDPRAELTAVIPVVDEVGNLWLVACFAEGWGERAPWDLFSYAFFFGVGPTGNAATIGWELHDDVPRIVGETASGAFQTVFLRLGDGNVALYTGLNVPEEFEGLILYETASTPHDGEVTRAQGEIPLSSHDALRGSVDELFEIRAAPPQDFPGFDADG